MSKPTIQQLFSMALQADYYVSKEGQQYKIQGAVPTGMYVIIDDDQRAEIIKFDDITFAQEEGFLVITTTRMALPT
jgi:hypothetical protein